MTNANQDLEPRLEKAESDIQQLRLAIAETNRNVSDLRSTVSTLADLLEVQSTETSQRFEQTNRNVSDLNSTVSTLADLLEVQSTETSQRFEQLAAQAEADRTLMLQLIQAIAQGRNGEG